MSIVDAAREALEREVLRELPVDIRAARLSTWFLRGQDELLTGLLDETPRIDDDLLPLIAAADAYPPRARLFIGSFFVVASAPPEALCAPLLLHPTRVRRSDDAWLISLDRQRGTAHRPLLAALGINSAAALERLAREPLDATSVHRMAVGLSRAEPAIDVAPAYRFPQLADLPDLASASGRTLLPAAALIAIPGDARALLQLEQLDFLADTDDRSAAAATALDPRPIGRCPASRIDADSLFELGLDQRRAVAQSARRSLTAVLGAPGTGKTFTLARLATAAAGQGESVLLAAPTEATRDRLEDALRRRTSRIATPHDFPTAEPRDRGADEPSDPRQRQRRRRALTDALELERQWSGAGGRWFGGWRRRRLERRIEAAEPSWSIATELSADARAERRSAHQQLEAALARAVMPAPADVVAAFRALGAESSRSARARLSAGIDWARLLAAYPLWVATTDEVFASLPAMELFDWVLVDDAAGIEPALLAALLTRGRRGVVTTVAASASAGADERGVGELVERLYAEGGTSWLDCQWRSHPRVARWWSRARFGDSLRYLSDRAGPLQSHIGVEIRRPPKGQALNTALDAVLSIAGDEVLLDDAGCSSLGILAIDPALAAALAAECQRRIPAAVAARHRLKVGDEADFAGDERDVMVVIVEADAADHLVAFSRARARLIVVTGADRVELGPQTLLAQALTAGEAPEPPSRSAVVPDGFLHALAERGFAVRTGLVRAGLELDVLAERNGRAAAIEFVGEGRSPDTDKLRTLAAAGMAVVPISLYRWRSDPNRCLAAIDGALDPGPNRG